MDEFFSEAQIGEIAADLRRRFSTSPRVGIVLGSGLKSIAEAVEAEAVIPYSEIPHFPQPTVEGHPGRLAVGLLEGQPVVVMQGRAHYYEGYSMARITLPIRVMQVWGVEILIVTNAAGGLNPAFRPGDVMLIRDHINLIGMAGLSPLRGPNLDRFGPRFPDMTHAYDAELRAHALAAAREAGIPIHQGVYICLAGPSFETPSDVRFLRMIGADAVGMSTVPEVTVARHGGMRVLGISGISNTLVGGDEGPGPSHEEVLEAGKILGPRVETIIRGVLRRL
ncbi:MAG: purine-nucleoside phosphorylase [Thermoflexia bacterium]|nr:MAG: purine-nucleoside phosphorylase [Thermoflexia bacterium]